MSTNLTAEELARREAIERASSSKVTVRLGVIPWNNLLVPVSDEKAHHFEKAVFKRMTVDDNRVIERIVSYKGERPDGKEQTLIDVIEYKRMLLKKNLLSWTIGVPIEREDGWLTEDCYDRISKMSGTLIEAIVDRYEDTMIITREEESVIDRQAAILFGKNSRGVSDACEAVSLYCSLSSFWEKFGIGMGVSLGDMDYRDYQRLRIMSSKEAQASRMANSVAKKPVTKIAGPGGRTRQSRGVVVG